jgi:hypothetical protein
MFIIHVTSYKYLQRYKENNTEIRNILNMLIFIAAYYQHSCPLFLFASLEKLKNANNNLKINYCNV